MKIDGGLDNNERIYAGAYVGTFAKKSNGDKAGVSIEGSKDGGFLLESEDGDTAQISMQAQKLYEKNMNEQAEEQMKKEYQQQAEDAKESADAEKDYFVYMSKMMEISRRIANGDKVPAADEKKLMEYNSKLYQISKSAAMMNADKKHKKYKSLFDEDENDKNNNNDSEKAGDNASEQVNVMGNSEGTGNSEGAGNSEGTGNTESIGNPDVIWNTETTGN